MDTTTSGGDEAAFMALLLGVIGIALVVAVVVNLIMTYFIWSAYKDVPVQFQKLGAGLVWLCAVPCIGSVMLIVCSVMIPQSFQAAFAARGRTDQGDCGFMLGLIGSIGMVVGGFVPFIGGLISLGCLIVFIIFIVRLHGFKRALASS